MQSVKKIPAKKRKKSSSTAKDKWAAEKVALKKIQVHFELQQSLLHDVRVRSAKQDMNSSDYVRRVIGLSYAKIQRPRISLSFSPEDFEFLSKRYGVAVDDRQELKRRVQIELLEHLSEQDW